MKINKIEKGIWQIRFGNPEEKVPTAVLKRDVAKEALQKMGDEKLSIDFNCINWKVTKRGLVIELPMDVNEDFYGFGLQMHSVNQSGRKKYMRVNSDPIADSGDSHAPVPFYISTAGYGLYVDTFRYTTFHMGTNGKKGTGKALAKKEEINKAYNEAALYAPARPEGERKIIIQIPIDGVDIYFFAGTKLTDVVCRYNLFSGGGCLPPMWGLGMWYRTYGGSNQEHVDKLADYFRSEEFPVDVLGFEPGWQSHSYSCTYKWGSRFPEPDKMLTKLNLQKYKPNLWEHVFVHPNADFYDEMEDCSADYEVWGGLIPDFSMDKARNIFIVHHTRDFIKHGVYGFKLDECDNSDYNFSNWSFPDSAEFPSGLDGEQMHSAIGLLYQNTIYEAFKGQNVRTLSQVRSSGSLAASMPFVLYSDLYSHSHFIRALVNSGFSGLLWSPEVRSCSSSKDLIRRLETVIFSPHALLNCWTIPNPPWQQADRDKNLAGEFMEDMEGTTAICKNLMELRMSFLPYLYSAFAEYYFRGKPPIRALVMDFEEDSNTHDIDDEYMFGESLLVAPLLETDGESRKVYLPNGNWFDFWTNEKFSGGQEIDYKAPIERIPLFVHENSIIPIAKPVQYVGEDTTFEFTINCYGNGDKEFSLYEDDGSTFDYEKEVYNVWKLSQNKNGETAVQKTGKYLVSKYRILEWKLI